MLRKPGMTEARQLEGKVETMQDVALRLAKRLFDRPLIQNSFRGAFVEELIAPMLFDRGWRHCGDDWSSWDFQHERGARLELKQSAFVQSWSNEGGATRNPTFNIEEKQGHWEGGAFHLYKAPARPASVYVFAWHGIEDRTQADHRNLNQWSFYPLGAAALPGGQKTIKLSGLKRLGAMECSAEVLSDKLELVRTGLA
ncbi:MAG: hypothetical protein R3C25_04545 [Hyphomonadaceae bacterium]